MSGQILRHLDERPPGTVDREPDAGAGPGAGIMGDAARTFAGDGMAGNAASEDVFLSVGHRGNEKHQEEYHHNYVGIQSAVHHVFKGTSLDSGQTGGEILYDDGGGGGGPTVRCLRAPGPVITYVPEGREQVGSHRLTGYALEGTRRPAAK